MGGTATWPDAGGLNDQAAWTFDAFRVLASVNHELDEAERKRNPG